MSTTTNGPDNNIQYTDAITDPIERKEKIVAKASQYLVINFLIALNISYNLALFHQDFYMHAPDPDSSTS